LIPVSAQSSTALAGFVGFVGLVGFSMRHLRDDDVAIVFRSAQDEESAQLRTFTFGQLAEGARFDEHAGSRARDQNDLGLGSRGMTNAPTM
jgi:hypothetical protein